MKRFALFCIIQAMTVFILTGCSGQQGEDLFTTPPSLPPGFISRNIISGGDENDIDVGLEIFQGLEITQEKLIGAGWDREYPVYCTVSEDGILKVSNERGGLSPPENGVMITIYGWTIDDTVKIKYSIELTRKSL